ncbi:cation efflux family protein [Psychromonas sp. CNPT3]|uniref:CDF family Co(II)/Ni(II) efflux transporter DmeF n=1 Tax=Psychromonas sp. CNPT3 TaxID=314282 RepID=UPI00006E9EAA|nr:CDF family Co(II)/Ni(II) efflux transporter DmeF [Psychromonas sp. CNPT3]AGH82201.1 cation efflux family protein [Psychromonas sp. CNPT3]
MTKHLETSTLKNWQHSHDFNQQDKRGERNTLYVLILTLLTMIVEIVAGTFYGSMALLADGWHMGTHVAAFLITLFAYYYVRKHKETNKFAFGPSKVSVLAGYTSAIALLLVAVIMLVESAMRLFSPQTIRFEEAIFVAVIGLIVNIISVFLLKGDHHHHHDHHHGEVHEHHQDHNLRAAYIHVLADALTSILAIVALVLGKYLGFKFLDPIMGIVGALIISRWAWGLLSQTGPILLDQSIDAHYQKEIIDCIENEKHQHVSDIHIWKVSSDHYAAIISIVSVTPLSVSDYKALLIPFKKLAHISIEVNSAQ